jgi:6-phosphogluconolactonase
VARDAEDAASRCADLLAAVEGHVVLTGGTSPERAYELAAERRPDWSGAELWWGDERCVPPDHEWSNFAMAKRALLDRLRAPASAVHRIQGELGPQRAADIYDAELEGVSLDFILNGVGPDAHFASLYPNEPTLRVRDRRAIPAPARLEPYVDRVTMTLPLFESAPLVVFLVTGADKAEAVQRAFGDPPSEAAPASLGRSKTGRTLLILDPPAAEKLTI